MFQPKFIFQFTRLYCIFLFQDLETDYRSETSANLLNQSKSPDDGKSVVSFSMTSNNGIDFQSPNGNMEESAWSLDLTEVDEVIEQAILDVTSAGHVFIRLLVKTVGVLQCEEDVERLVLENLPSRFREIHLKNCKRIFTSKLSTYLEKARFSTEDDEIFFHGKLLADYIFTLLETLFGVMQRLLYVSHLLFLSKNGNRRDTDIKVRIRKEILEYWDEIEDMIIQEVESHLQDPDILKITDQLNTVSVSKRNDDLVSMDDDQFTSDSQSLVFKPSSKHGSILFKKIVEYNVRSCVLIKNYKDDNAIYETRKILDVIQSFLEKELIPVIQSTVNQEMIEIQLNPSLFLPSNDIEGKSDTKKPCLAAEKACHVSENLFNYWDQLFQHRTMVALILERLLRGFSSSAWENLESVLFPIYPATLEFRKSSLRFLQKDQFYIAMKKSMFSGKTAFDEFAQISNLPNESLKSTFDDNSLNIQYLQELKTIWISKFWDLSSLNYPFETMQVETIHVLFLSCNTDLIYFSRDLLTNL